MADHLPYCTHCGAKQLTLNPGFCQFCGRPIVQVAASRRKGVPKLVLVVLAALATIAAVEIGLLAAGWPRTKPAPHVPLASTSPQLQAAVADRVASPSPSPMVMPSETAAASPTTAPSPFATLMPSPASGAVTPQPVQLYSLAWSPDGTLLAVGSTTGVYLYDTATWQEIWFIPLLEGGARSVAFSFDGKLLGTEGQQMQVWHVADGSFAYDLGGTELLAASPTEGLWATVGEEGSSSDKLRLWQTSDGQLVRTIAMGEGYATTVAFSADGRFIAAAGGTISAAGGGIAVGMPSVWQTADGQRIASLNWELPEGFWSWADVVFRPNSSTVVAVGHFFILLLWDGSSGALIRQISGPDDRPFLSEVYAVDFSPNGSVFATSHADSSGSHGGSIQLWQADGTPGLLWQLTVGPRDVTFSPDGSSMAALVGDSLMLFNPADGSTVREIKPTWHQGILPTPTPTPSYVGLELPSDWKEYLYVGSPNSDLHIRLRYHPEWQPIGDEPGYENENGDVAFRGPSLEDHDSESAMMVFITQWGCGRQPETPGDPAKVEEIRKASLLNVPGGSLSGERVFVTGGSWPLLVPGTYAEFDAVYPSAGRRQVREIELVTYPKPGRCVNAFLVDELQDISEQDRLDFSRMLASIEFEDEQHPFPTAPPTPMPTPDAGSRPALPLQILFEAEVASSAKHKEADITLEIKDAQGNSASGVEVWMKFPYLTDKLGTSYDGRYYVSYGPGSGSRETVTVEVYWNQELIATQEFVIIWE